MPRGHADYDAVPGSQIVQPGGDVAELAARLGAISVYERGGNVLFAESFEYGLGLWHPPTPNYANDTWTLVAGASAHGDFHAKYARNGGVNATLMAAEVFVPSLSPFGIEWAFTLDAPDSLGNPGGSYSLPLDQQLEFLCTLNTGTRRVQSAFQITVDGSSNVQPSVLVSGGGYQNVGSALRMIGGYVAWHHIKWVVDYSVPGYVRAQLDGTPLAVSGIACRSAVDTTAPSLQVVFAQFTDLRSTHLDSILVTQNETAV